MAEITGLTLRQLCAALETGECTAKQATEAYQKQIAAVDGDLGAYITQTGPAALEAAAQTDARRAKGEKLPPLAGVPMALKDNICTKGIKTTCASRMLQNFVPAYDATAASLLQKQGAVLLGKLNMDEFAMGSSGETSAFGPVKNPVDKSRVPGGSSGGSAAAVAANLAAFALGSDTGGSIRQPAAFCGVVGIKPTYGRVSRNGLVAFASSLDQIGSITRTVEDCAMVLQAICGHDPGDSTSSPKAVPDFCAGLEDGVKGMKFALPGELLGDEIAPDVRQAVLAAAQSYESMGAVVQPVSMPAMRLALPAYTVISAAEASGNLARFDGVRFGARAEEFASIEELYANTRGRFFGPEVKRRILLGTYVLSARGRTYYEKALQARTMVINDFNRLFEAENFDLVLSPTAPTTAWSFEKKAGRAVLQNADLCTAPASLAGLPALSMPCGANGGGLPIGLQLVGKAFAEQTVLQAARALERQQGGAPA